MDVETDILDDGDDGAGVEIMLVRLFGFRHLEAGTAAAAFELILVPETSDDEAVSTKSYPVFFALLLVRAL